MLKWIWIISIFSIGIMHHGFDYWHPKWALMLALISIAMGIRIAIDWTWSAGACFAYTSISGLYLFAWRDNYLSLFDTKTGTMVDAMAAASLVAFSFLGIFFSAFEEKKFKEVRLGFAIASVTDSIWVFWQSYWHWPQRFTQGGFFDQGSLNACFLAATFPFLLEQNFPRSIKIIPILAIIVTCVLDGASNGFGVSLVVFGSLFLFRKFSARNLAIAFGAFGLLIWAFAHLNPLIFDSSGRFTIYRLCLTCFRNSPWPYIIFGVGNGSFPILLPILQKANHFMPQSGGDWFWVHSDWLQTLLEQGIVGLCLYFWLAFDCFKAVIKKKDRFLFASLMGVCGTAIFQYPVHLALFAFLIASVVAMSLNKTKLVSDIPA